MIHYQPARTNQETIVLKFKWVKAKSLTTTHQARNAKCK